MADISQVEEISSRQHRALAALLEQPTIGKASEVSGVPVRTLHSWLKEPSFSAEYSSMRRQATQQAIARIQQYSANAAGTLVQLMASDKPAAVRLAAARTVMELAIKSVEIDDIAARLEALEAKYAEKTT